MKMIGKCVGKGPGGRDCVCCGEAPAHRKALKRSAKRRERQTWRIEVAR